MGSGDQYPSYNGSNSPVPQIKISKVINAIKSLKAQ